MLSKIPVNSIINPYINKLISKYRSIMIDATDFVMNLGCFISKNKTLRFLARVNKKHVSIKISREIVK